MKKIVGTFLGAMLALSVGMQNPAFSVGLSGVTRIPRSDVEKVYMREKSRAMEPFAHILFCGKAPAECAATGGASVIDYSRQNRKLLMAVNRRVNRAIQPRADNGFGQGLDEWSLAPQYGDCDDYAITKRHELIASGMPAGALRLASAKTAWGEGHLVLIVRTSKGDMVLDNLTDAIRPFNKTSLRWRQIQSAENPRVWYNL